MQSFEKVYLSFRKLYIPEKLYILCETLNTKLLYPHRYIKYSYNVIIFGIYTAMTYNVSLHNYIELLYIHICVYIGIYVCVCVYISKNFGEP